MHGADKHWLRHLVVQVDCAEGQSRWGPKPGKEPDISLARWATAPTHPTPTSCGSKIGMTFVEKGHSSFIFLHTISCACLESCLNPPFPELPLPGSAQQRHCAVSQSLCDISAQHVIATAKWDHCRLGPESLAGKRKKVQSPSECRNLQVFVSKLADANVFNFKHCNTNVFAISS